MLVCDWRPRIAIAVPWRSAWRHGLQFRPRGWRIILGDHLFASPSFGSGGTLAGSGPARGPQDEHPPDEPAHQDHAAFEQLFTRHSPALFEYLCGMTHGDRELASDLVQETFLRAYMARVALTEVERPHAWLFRIATNLVLTARRRRPIAWIPLGAIEPQPGADSSNQWRVPQALIDRSPDVAAEVAERESVWRVLTALPPRCHRVGGRRCCCKRRAASPRVRSLRC
jgi:DNA-directed RNA polymerase specialized sigma24 family protein